MADISNLKINERSNVERPNLRDTETGNKNWENWFISKGKCENGQIVSSKECRMDGQFQNWQFLEPNFGFANWKDLKIC